MRISRRRALSLVPAAGLVTVARPGASAAAVAPAPAADLSRLVANTVAVLAGTTESNSRPEVAGKVAAIERTARSRLADLAAAGPGELFAGLPLGTSDPNLSRSFQYLAEIALATRTPGAGLVDDQAVQHQVIDALAWLHEHHYGDQDSGYYGNWFSWEIGISTSVSRTLVLLADQFATHRPDLTATFVASMDAYLRNGKDGDIDLDSRFHTGANLADITTNRVLQGAVLGDPARVGKAITDQATVFATIDPYHLNHGVTDGYYADGSFIQHHSVAYTGSYGRALLTRVVQAVKILDGTSYAGDANLVDVVRGWVVDGFAPLIFEGWMMEAVKGRAVSRTATGYTDVAAVVEAIVDLADYVGGADAVALRGYVKFIRSTSRATLDPSTFVSPVSVLRYADLLADESVPAADLNQERRSVAFNAMDRSVHRRPGYAFTLARSSDRISRYEYMNGENLMPWFQGEGAHYLYLAGEDQTTTYGVDYFTTVSPYRLAGVTAPVAERRTVPELYGRFWYENPDHPLGFTSSSESQNTYVYFPRGTNRLSGGVTLGPYGSAALVQADDVPYVDKQAGVLPADFVVYQNARSTKSWFLLDDEIVVLASGITDPAGRAVVTTIDSRGAAPTDQVVLTGARRDGGPWSGTGTAGLRWLHYANRTAATAVGYLFLDVPEVTVRLAEVTRSRRVVRAANPDTPVTRKVFDVSVDHRPGARPAALAYAIVPNADAGRLAGYRRGPLAVLANTPRVQAIRHTGLGLTAVNAFTDGWVRAHRLVVHGPAAVLLRHQPDGTVAIAVADPTMDRGRVAVTVRGRALTPVSADERITVRPVPGGTLVVADTHQVHGRGLTAVLRPR